MEVKQTVLILGAGVMQGPALKFARQLGFTVAAADGNSNAPCRALADHFESIDLKDTAALTAFAKELHRKDGGLAGVFTAGTDFSGPVAFIAAQIGLPGVSCETAANATDKERMRRCFAAAGVPSPAFLTVTTPSQTPPRFGYPAVVKPVDNMGARGCRLVSCNDELYDACIAALSCSRSSRAIIEEYMDGPEYSVDALVYRGEVTICGLAERHIRYPPYFIEMGHTMPAILDQSTEQMLLEVFSAGIRALGITDGAAKGDLKLTAKGAMIGEIAARLSGGYMSGWTYPYASGVEPTLGALRIACGLSPGNLTPNRRWVSAERAFISIPGTITALHGLETAANIEYVKDLFCRVQKGDTVSFPENNVSKCGNVISAAPSRVAAVTAAETAARMTLVELAAPCAATETFLAAPLDTRFPPSAFTVCNDLNAALESLPETVFSASRYLSVCPFPAFTSSLLRDYAGRTPAESLDAVRVITGQPLPIDSRGVLGRGFWRAMLRGSYQGAAYYVKKFERGGSQTL